MWESYAPPHEDLRQSPVGLQWWAVAAKRPLVSPGATTSYLQDLGRLINLPEPQITHLNKREIKIGPTSQGC